MARRQRDELLAPAVEERVGATRSASARVATRAAKAASISRSVLALQDMNLQPDGAGRFLHVSECDLGDVGLVGLTSTAIIAALGTSSCSSSSRLRSELSVRKAHAR